MTTVKRSARARRGRRRNDARCAVAGPHDAARTVRDGDSAERASGRDSARRLRNAEQARYSPLLCYRQPNSRACRFAAGRSPRCRWTPRQRFRLLRESARRRDRRGRRRHRSVLLARLARCVAARRSRAPVLRRANRRTARRWGIASPLRAASWCSRPTTEAPASAASLPNDYCVSPNLRAFSRAGRRRCCARSHALPARCTFPRSSRWKKPSAAGSAAVGVAWCRSIAKARKHQVSRRRSAGGATWYTPRLPRRAGLLGARASLVSAAPSLATKLGSLELAYPTLMGSGCYGTGEEFAPFADLSRIGAIVLKSVTRLPRLGNPTPRLVHTPAGMLNAIGLQNPGLDWYLERELHKSATGRAGSSAASRVSQLTIMPTSASGLPHVRRLRRSSSTSRVRTSRAKVRPSAATRH